MTGGRLAGGFPQRLRTLRERRRVSRGERVPSLIEATALADFFDVSLDELWGRK